MLRINHLTGFGTRRQTGGITATHWRFRATSFAAADGGSPGAADYWAIEWHASNGIFAGATIGGTNLTNGLAYGASGIAIFNASNVESVTGGYNLNTMQDTNPGGTSLMLTGAGVTAGFYLRVIFGSAVAIGAVSMRVQTGQAHRQPRAIALEYSTDSGSTWTAYATLNNATKMTHPKWESITSGSTIAAVAT